MNKYGELRTPKLFSRHKKCACCISFLWIAVFIAGCFDSYDYRTPSDLREKLDHIETVKLETLSESAPVTVQQATAKHTEQLKDPNEPAEPVKLTLEQVRMATLENNLGLKAELISPAIAQTLVSEEQAKFEAVFYGSGSLANSESGDKSSVTRTTLYNAGIKKPLTTGGSVAVEFPFSDADVTDEKGLAQAGMSIVYVQSLLRGAGTSINTQSIRIVQMKKDMTDAGTKLEMINSLAEADVVYWRLFSARKQLEVRREQYKLAQDQLGHARKKVASRAAARIEIVRAEAGVASRLEAVINAENDVENRCRNLRRIMNCPDLPLDDNAPIIPQTMPDPLGLELNVDRLIRYALDNRMDNIQLDMQLAVDKLDIEIARNAALPDLAVTGRYNLAGQSEGYSGSYNRLYTSPSDSVYVGLSLSIPLGNQASEAKLHRARLNRLVHEARKKELEQFIKQQVREAASDLQTNWRRILASEQGVEAAYRDYQVEQSQFQLGVRTSTDVLLAATRLADAQLSRISAFADYEIARISLARATGTLLGYSKIVIRSIDIEL